MTRFTYARSSPTITSRRSLRRPASTACPPGTATSWTSSSSTHRRSRITPCPLGPYRRGLDQLLPYANQDQLRSRPPPPVAFHPIQSGIGPEVQSESSRSIMCVDDQLVTGHRGEAAGVGRSRRVEAASRDRATVPSMPGTGTSQLCSRCRSRNSWQAPAARRMSEPPTSSAGNVSPFSVAIMRT